MLARVFSRLSWGKGVPSGLVIKKQQNSHKTPTKIFRENRPNIKYLQQKLLTNLTMILVRPLTYSYIYNFLLSKREVSVFKLKSHNLRKPNPAYNSSPKSIKYKTKKLSSSSHVPSFSFYIRTKTSLPLLYISNSSNSNILLAPRVALKWNLILILMCWLWMPSPWSSSFSCSLTPCRLKPQDLLVLEVIINQLLLILSR